MQPTAATEVTALPATPTVPAGTAGPTAAPTASPVVEARVVEVEWPPVMRLGDSDVIRLAVLPASDVLTVTTEFADHTTITETLPIPHLAGFDLAGVARLDAVGFASSPNGDQAQSIRPGQPITWRWTDAAPLVGWKAPVGAQSTFAVAALTGQPSGRGRGQPLRPRPDSRGAVTPRPHHA